MRPLVGSISRLIIRSVVVLPEPELPTRATTSPSADREREVVHGRHGRRSVTEALGDVIELDHPCTITSPSDGRTGTAGPRRAVRQRANVSSIRSTSGPSG